MVAVSYCLVVCCGVCLTYCLAVVGCWSPGVVAKLDFGAVDFSWISGGFVVIEFDSLEKKSVTSII